MRVQYDTITKFENDKTLICTNYIDIFDDFFITEYQLVQIGKVLKATKLKYYDIVTKSDKEIDIKKYRRPREKKQDVNLDIFDFKEGKIVESIYLGKMKLSDLYKFTKTK